MAVTFLYRNVQGEKGDVFYEGCSKFTCVKKGKKLKWIESPASDRCCSYEGTLYPPGQEVARLTTSNNCSQVTSMTTITTTILYINPQAEVEDQFGGSGRGQATGPSVVEINEQIEDNIIYQQPNWIFPEMMFF